MTQQKNARKIKFCPTPANTPPEHEGSDATHYIQKLKLWKANKAPSPTSKLLYFDL